MKRWTVTLAVIVIGTFVAMGCSGGGQSPVTPDTGPNFTSGTSKEGANTQAHLWGYYDLYFDFESMTVEAVPNRNLMFTANVVDFVNLDYSNLAFTIHGTPVDPGGQWIDVDIDVSITHPFPGLHQYDGWDIRGIFMGVGSGALDFNPALRYAVYGDDQDMYDRDLGDDPDIGYPDPYDGLVGNPDGYTRWWNADEFTDPGPLGYTQGRLATPGYQPNLTATLNPYKYFCDGLGPQDDLWTWLNDGTNADNHGIYTAGSTNTRNYYLRFPMPNPNVNYGYAITATWGEAPAEPPPAYVENAVEAVALSVLVTDDVYYIDPGDNGGDLILDISVWMWGVGTGVTTEYIQPSTIWIESEVLGSAVELPPADMIPVGGGDNYSTYHTELPAINVTSSDDSEFWVICEYSEYDYTCNYPAAAPTDPLAAFFRYDLYISPTGYCADVTVTGIDFDPPNGVGDAAAIPYTGVEIYGTGFEGTTGTVQFQGTLTIDATNVVSNGTDTITCDVDFTGATGGDFYDVYVMNECGNDATAADLVEIVCSDVQVTGVDFDPPNGVSDACAVPYTDVEISGSGFDGATATVQFQGTLTIDATNVVSNGTDTITFDVDFTGATIGDLYDVYVMNECGNDATAADLVEIVYGIRLWDGGTPGGGVITPPGPSGTLIDITVRVQDGGAYFVVDTGNPNGGIVDRYNPALDTLMMSSTPMTVTNPAAPAANCTHGNADIESNEGGGSGVHLMIAPGWHWYMNGSCSGVGGVGYVNYPPDYPCDVTSDGSGSAWGYHGFMGGPYRDYMYMPPWANAGNINYNTGGNFDGLFSYQIVALGAGDGPDQLWAVRTVSPHIYKYSGRYWSAYGGTSFGNTGTSDGEISTPRDITLNDDSRIFILDEPSAGCTRLQAFDTSGNFLSTSDPSYSAVGGGGGNPYRFDYNEFESCLYVLYHNDTVQVFKDFLE